MNSSNKNTNISKKQLTEKLKTDISILTNDLKKTLSNLESALDLVSVQEENAGTSKKKSFQVLTLVDYLKIMKYLKRDLNNIAKKCGEFIQNVSKLEVESVAVGELMSLYTSEDEDTNTMSIDDTQELSQSFKDVSILSTTDISNLQADFSQPLVIAIKLENFSSDTQNYFTSTPSDLDSKNKRVSITKDEVPSKILKLSYKIRDLTTKEENEGKIDGAKKEALSDLNNLIDIKDKILVPKMYQCNQSNEHVIFTQFIWKTFYDCGDQEDVSRKTIFVECTDQAKLPYIATLSFTVLNFTESVPLNSGKGKIILVVSHTQFDSWISKFLMWRTDFSNRNKINFYFLSKENTIDFLEWSETGGVLVIIFDIFQQIYNYKEDMDVAKQSIYDCIFNSETDLFIFDLLYTEKDNFDFEIIKKMTNFKLIFGNDNTIINIDDQSYYFTAGNIKSSH